MHIHNLLLLLFVLLLLLLFKDYNILCTKSRGVNEPNWAEY